jgi:eukaryotic-like serine/threonine-protein kinase
MAVRFEANVEPVTGYQLIERIGSGGFGEVWKCLAPGGIYKAIKIIHGDLRSKDNDLVRYAEQELKSLERVKQVRHPYLLAIDRYDIVEGRLLIVMELADCNLWERFRHHRLKGLPGIPREELLVYMDETAEVLDLMNGEHGLLHLDIKPQNIFLQWNHVKVGDFGQVKDLQGLAAQVTGGITPVYAAPETFDGIVTRACDQYSLACVYQELLTGIRPFDGTSMNQLLMQHLTAAPNLNPSPPSDRPALQRALAKKHDERFSTCYDFVQAIRNGADVTQSNGLGNGNDGSRITLTASLLGNTENNHSFKVDGTNKSDQGLENYAQSVVGSSVISLIEEAQITAPPKITGGGTFQPVLVIGIGGMGLQCLNRFEDEIESRFGPRSELQSIQLIYIDTDSTSMHNINNTKSRGRGNAIPKADAYFANLNRASYYMKPRIGGRAITEGWFDNQLLNRLARIPTTSGYRPLGRLAFADHFRTISQLLTTKLQACVAATHLESTIAATGLSLRSNQPRVYILNSLMGGTGSGMMLDIAYTVRHRLKKLGYTNPDVQGLLLIPTDENGSEISPLARSNVYAALTEINHFSRIESKFTMHFDERTPPIIDIAPPFQCVYLIPTTLQNTNTPVSSITPSNIKHSRRPASESQLNPNLNAQDCQTSGNQMDPTSIVVNRIILDMVTMVGIKADELRPATNTSYGVTVRSFGCTEYSWPRCAIIERTTRVLSGVLITHWVSPDISRARHRIPVWVSEKMREYSLDVDSVNQNLIRAASTLFNDTITIYIARLIEPVTPKGWMSRNPDANKLLLILDTFGKTIGYPSNSKQSTALEEIFRTTTSDIASVGLVKMTRAIHSMFDDPDFRIASAEEAIQQVLNFLHASRIESETEAERCEKIARLGYDTIMAYIHPNTGSKRIPSHELMECLRTYPIAQYQSHIARSSGKLFEYLKSNLAELRNSVSATRHRMVEIQALCVAELEKPDPVLDANQLMPTGCSTIEQAAQRFLAVLNDDDLLEVERQVQYGIEERFGGLYQAAVNSTLDGQSILDVIRVQARKYLNARLGAVDFVTMFYNKYGDAKHIRRVISESFRSTSPSLTGSGPWTNHAFSIIGCPAPSESDDLKEIVSNLISLEHNSACINMPDSLTIYREVPHVPLNVLPQLGPAWESAYQMMTDSNQGVLHSRNDIPHWIGVDAE